MALSIPTLNRGLSNTFIRYCYAKYKKVAIQKLISIGFDPLRCETPFGKLLDERVVEYPWLFSRLSSSSNKILLDAGSVLNFRYLIEQEQIRTRNVTISTLAPEKKAFWTLGLSYIYEDFRKSCLRDSHFDEIACLSVIEHVGMDNTKFYSEGAAYNERSETSYLDFLSELRRVLKPGGTLYISMPFGVNKNYGWLQTFDGDMVDSIVGAFSPERVAESYFRYGEAGWMACSRAEATDCHYFDVHNDAATHRNDRAIAAEAVVLLELTK